MNDESQSIVSEPDLQDVSLLDTDIAPSPATPSAPAVTPEPGADTPEVAKEEAKSDAEDTPAPETPKETQPVDDKADRARIAAQEYQNRQRTRQQVAAQIDQNYAPKSEQDLLAEGMSAQEAKFQALREELNYKEQRTQIAELNAGMQAEAVNVVNDYGVFNPKSSDYDEGFTQEVEQAYKTAARLVTDENGIVTNAEIPLYDFYQRMAKIYERGSSKGSAQGTKAALETLSRVEDTVGGSSSTNKGDSLADLEERLGNFVIT